MNKNVHLSLKSLTILSITAAGFIRTAEISPASSQEQEEKDKQLFEAIERGWPKRALSTLLKGGASPNARHHETGEPILNYAVRTQLPSSLSRGSEIEIVDLLLQKGASPNQVDSQGRTSLEWVVGPNFVYSHQQKPLLDMLIKHGADVNKRFWDKTVGKKVPFLAKLLLENLPEVAKKAIEAGANVSESLAYLSDVPLSRGSEQEKAVKRRHYINQLKKLRQDVLKSQFGIEQSIKESTALPEDVSQLNN